MCPRIYLCPFEDCQESFTDVKLLENHQNTHTFKRVEFKCDRANCDKTYACKSHLKRHIETFHEKLTTKNTYPCNLCNKILKTKDTLTKHVDKIHNSNRLKCIRCNKQFTKVQNLQIHEYDHTGIKPFTCGFENCGKSFLLPSKLKNHEKTHKGYKCSEKECEMQFDTWSLLRKHKKMHFKNFTCQICGRCFTKKNNLKSHSKTHDDQRECFHCPFDNCPRFYYFKSNLDQHIRSFHADKTLICINSNCKQKFANQTKLDKHLKSKICQKVKRKKKKRKRNLKLKLIGFNYDSSE